jgi:hypothetical protein
MNARWFGTWLALWVVGSLLVIHYALHGGTDLSASIVFVVAAVIAFGIVAVLRRVLGRPGRRNGVH